MIFMRVAKERLADVRPTSWQELHELLAERGMRYEKKGSGAVISVGDEVIKASSVSKRFSLSKLEASLGEYVHADTDIAVKKHEPEPLSPANDNEDWRAYQQFRSTFYADKKDARAAMQKQISDERKALMKIQSDERKTHIGSKSWRGRGRELNNTRSLFAAKHQREKLELKERHAALRAAFNK